MNIKKPIKNFIVKFITAFVDSIRPFLGPKGSCIYKTTCRQYAKETLKKNNIFIAIPMICLRILSCNPITAIFLKFKKKT